MEDAIEDMCTFVGKYGGGATPKFINALEQWSRSLNSRRAVHSSTFKALGALDFKQCPEYPWMMLKAAMSAPDGPWMRDGQSRLISSADAAQVIGSKKSLCVAATSYMRVAVDWFTEKVEEYNPVEFAQVVGRFEVDAVMFIHGKKCKDL
eukprot:7631670-Pyramimonas_sp.AAC.1